MAFIPGINVYAAGFLSGFVGSGGDLKQGIIGGITAGIGGIGAVKNLQGVGQALAHGAIGGLSSVASGGNFKDGFLSGGFGVAVGGFGSTGYVGLNILRDATVGGLGSVIGGGKFKNGASSAAFASAIRSASQLASNKVDDSAGGDVSLEDFPELAGDPRDDVFTGEEVDVSMSVIAKKLLVEATKKAPKPAASRAPKSI